MTETDHNKACIKYYGPFRLAIVTMWLVSLTLSSLMHQYHHGYIGIFSLLLFYIFITFGQGQQERNYQDHRFFYPYLDKAIAGMLMAFLHFEIVSFLVILLTSAVPMSTENRQQKILSSLTILASAGFGYVFFSGMPYISELHSAVLVVIAGGFFISVMNNLRSKNLLLTHDAETKKHINTDLSLRVSQMSRYFSPSVRRAILNDHQFNNVSEEKHISIMFSDLNGFTDLAEQLNPDELAEFLNVYLSQMSEIAVRFGGTIDKIMGDSIMVFFGDPESRGVKKDAINCVAMAIAMRKAMAKLTSRWIDAGIENPPSLRIGINSGLCKVGHFGTANHLNYTLLGRAVNLASRLESSALGEEILISLSTYNLIKNIIECENKGQLEFKGFNQPVIAYRVLDFLNHQ
ncbi:MAG: adenylate/guanylate cyclase domain-containing protein [Porticoccaceae bacterium]|nr:adenylate/guanylate cyclase domain-containing protein [Porticoccaceae bacterium]